jgi:hypothetical protein
VFSNRLFFKKQKIAYQANEKYAPMNFSSDEPIAKIIPTAIGS